MNEQAQLIKVETHAVEMEALSIERVTDFEEEPSAPASACCCCCCD